MDVDYDIFEIVKITRDFWLIDTESYQRNYCTKHGQPLASGYYVANWPEHIRARRFNEHTAFHGPFKLREEAQAARTEMQKDRKFSLAMLSEIGSAAARTSSRIEVKKATSQKLRLIKSIKTEQPACEWKKGIAELQFAD
jgi:hypothetical protein